MQTAELRRSLESTAVQRDAKAFAETMQQYAAAMQQGDRALQESVALEQERKSNIAGSAASLKQFDELRAASKEVSDFYGTLGAASTTYSAKLDMLGERMAGFGARADELRKQLESEDVQADPEKFAELQRQYEHALSQKDRASAELDKLNLSGADTRVATLSDSLTRIGATIGGGGNDAAIQRDMLSVEEKQLTVLETIRDGNTGATWG